MLCAVMLEGTECEKESFFLIAMDIQCRFSIWRNAKVKIHKSLFFVFRHVGYGLSLQKRHVDCDKI